MNLFVVISERDQYRVIIIDLEITINFMLISTNSFVRVVRVKLSLICLIENVDDVQILMTHVVSDPLVALVLNKHTDLEIAEYRELNHFLDKSFFPLA